MGEESREKNKVKSSAGGTRFHPDTLCVCTSFVYERFRKFLKNWRESAEKVHSEKMGKMSSE